MGQSTVCAKTFLKYHKTGNYARADIVDQLSSPPMTIDNYYRLEIERGNANRGRYSFNWGNLYRYRV